MVKTIRFYSILSTFIMASCASNKTIDGVDWTAPSNLPAYVYTTPAFLNNKEPTRPPRPPQITPPSPAHAPNFTPTNKPNFIPPPPPFNFIIDFGD
jgi:hypothetical protein|tara:strand:+ start:882 stop:1169 length:288 start_codon:yes stop_codon:yes gene_type:complete